jgi:hypothetical protein
LEFNPALWTGPSGACSWLTLAVQGVILALRTGWILAVKAPCTRTLWRRGSKLPSFVPSGSIHRLANTMVRVALFLAVSAAITQLSWRSRRDLRSHGFYRFFAFELPSALILLNARCGFATRSRLANWCHGSSELPRSDWQLKDSGYLRLCGRQHKRKYSEIFSS